MTKLQDYRTFLGDPYEIKTIDLEDVIYRKLENGIEFEVSDISGHSHKCTIYVWDSRVHKEIISIYSVPSDKTSLKDILGYLAVKYQNLSSQIQVEREGQTE